MPIKRKSCRITERSRMKQMQAEGYSVPQISNALSVHEEIVEQVLDGTWDKGEKRQQAEQAKLNVERRVSAEKEKEREAAALGAAVADGLVRAGVVPQQPPEPPPEPAGATH